MPLGFERLNERHQRPNAHINFIKPLETSDKATAERFLQCIAAQCYPVMKKHHITVMSLEEYAPNPEFLGRNFNAGEVIQLVLKDKQGRWLSMKFVQMVMMHELAHCKQMNHSRNFWNVRNEYAQQMEDLWQRKYVGEGIWGRGRGLDDGAFIHEGAPDDTQVPNQLCGGSYRKRGRKRKRGQAGEPHGTEKLTYAERQQRRIAKKFGKHGEGASLGDDELLRGAIETMQGGKRGAGKPRVANSKRGRELRANAALARFEQAKASTPESKDDDTESDYDNDSDFDGTQGLAIKVEGGHEFIKVCGDEVDDEQDGARNEIKDLRSLGLISKDDAKSFVAIKEEPQSPQQSPTQTTTSCAYSGVHSPTARMQPTCPGSKDVDEDAETESDSNDEVTNPLLDPNSKAENINTNNAANDNLPSSGDDKTTKSTASHSVDDTAEVDAKPQSNRTIIICSVCSLENEGSPPTCTACANVLRPDLMPGCWRCRTQSCLDLSYINVGDAGRCGICGSQKPSVGKSSNTGIERDFGLTRADILRWE